MMTGRWLSAVLTICTVMVMPRGAAAADGVRMGAGVSISDFGDVVVATAGTNVPLSIMPMVFVPIDLSSKFRIEPEIGFAWGKTSASSTASHTQSYTLLHVGAGVFGKASREHFTAYYGARVGYLRFSESDTGPYSGSDNSSDGYSVAPAVGGEYFFSDAVSLGGEVQVRYTSSTVKGNSGDLTIHEKTAGTHGALTLRFWF